MCLGKARFGQRFPFTVKNHYGWALPWAYSVMSTCLRQHSAICGASAGLPVPVPRISTASAELP
jgi:hypothetical protein